MKQAPKPRVLFVSIGAIYGGAETYLVKLARLLLQSFDLAAVVNNDTLAADLASLGVSVRNISKDPQRWGGRYKSAVKALLELIRSFRPHAVQLNGQPEAYLSFFAARRGVPIVATRHTPLDDTFLKAGSKIPVWLKRRIVVASFRRAQVVVCVSKLLQSQMGRYIENERLISIPTWLPESTVPRTRSFDSSASPFKLLFVGRVVKVKGIFDLIDALRQLENATLDVVGDGDDLKAAKQQCRSLPVTFHGFQAVCSPFYDQADLLVFPSQEGFEGLPQVPLEAMAAGLPCLGSDILAMQEIVSDGQPHALFRTGDPVDLANQIRKLQSDPIRLTELSRAGAERITARYTSDSVSSTYLALFDRLSRAPATRVDTPYHDR